VRAAGLEAPPAHSVRMSILSGLLHKIGLGNGAGDRRPARVFLLDDDTLRHEWFAKQFRGHQLDVAVEPARAVELLSTNHYDLIFLDHDLLPEHYYAEGFDDERSGYAVARWLAETPSRHAAASIIVHTRNADGALRMVELLRGVGRQAEHVPYPLLAPKIKQLRWQ
jgi:CheY-like chemotaxis protein